MKYSVKDYSRTAASKGWGAGWPTCSARTQTAVVVAPLSGVKVVVHKRIARLVYLLIAETERRGYLLRPGQCWGGNCRAIAGTSTPSNHSWWLAVDLNSLANAYVAKRLGYPVTDMPTWLPLLWNAFGFAWGGDYSGSKADAMHLEFMGSPEDADDMTALAEVRLKEAQQRDGVWVITDMEDDDVDLHRGRQMDEILARLQAITGATPDPGKFTAAPLVEATWRSDMPEGHGVPILHLRQASLGVLALLARPEADVDEQQLAAALAPLLPTAAPAVLAQLSDADVKRIAAAANDEDDARERQRLAQPAG